MEVLKNLLKFSQKKAVLMFQETENLKNYLYSGNGSPEKSFYISGSNFPSLNKTLKIFLIFQKMEFSSPKLEKLLIYQEGSIKAPKTNKKFVPKKFLKHREVSCDYLYRAVKYREIICGHLYSAVKHWEILCEHLKLIQI